MTTDVAFPTECETAPTGGLVPYAKNARLHSPEQVQEIAASIVQFGFNNPVLVDAEGGIVAGHGRVMAAQKLGLDRVPIVRLGHLTETQKRAYILADNRIAENSSWDLNLLSEELRGLDQLGEDVTVLGFAEAQLESLLSGADVDALFGPAPEDGGPEDGGPDPFLNAGDAPRASLADRFGVVPFSVLSAREGTWQARKRAWLSLGIRSEVGRGKDRARTFGQDLMRGEHTVGGGK